MKLNFRFFNIILLFVFAFLIGGCATSVYVGEDYASENVQTIKTSEDFVYSVFKKSLGDVNVKMGISRTPINEVLSLYVQIENLSYATPYEFKVDDLRLYDADSELQFITSNNYLSIFQNQEASSMAALSSMSSTLTTMTGMNANYNEFSQSMVQNSAQETNKSAFSQMEELGNRILKHTVKYSSTISPRRSQYYYFFFEDKGKYPIRVLYKGLDYQFKL